MDERSDTKKVREGRREKETKTKINPERSPISATKPS